MQAGISFFDQVTISLDKAILLQNQPPSSGAEIALL